MPVGTTPFQGREPGSIPGASSMRWCGVTAAREQRLCTFRRHGSSFSRRMKRGIHRLNEGLRLPVAVRARMSSHPWSPYFSRDECLRDYILKICISVTPGRRGLLRVTNEGREYIFQMSPLSTVPSSSPFMVHLVGCLAGLQPRGPGGAEIACVVAQQGCHPARLGARERSEAFTCSSSDRQDVGLEAAIV